MRRGRKLSRAIAFLAVAFLGGAGGGVVVRVLSPSTSTQVIERTVVETPRAVQLSGETLDVAAVVAAVGPCVVNVEASHGESLFDPISVASGIILSANGEVLTNAHVVDGATSITVTLAGETKERKATLVGLDRATDVALLRIIGASRLPAATLGRSSAVRVGDDVVAIGNALALEGGPTVTRGIVSGLDRSLQTEAGTIEGLIQTDAAISSGNSGGPLVNALGEVVGMNTAAAPSSPATVVENIGFAIPIDDAMAVVARLSSGLAAR